MRVLTKILVALLVAVAGATAAYGVGYAMEHQATAEQPRTRTAPSAPSPGKPRPSSSPEADDTERPEPSAVPTEQGPSNEGPSSEGASDEPTNEPDADEQPGGPATEAPAEPELEPGPRLLGPGDAGAEVRDLQARLKQIAWLSGPVTGTYDATTDTAVRGFQAKREIPVTGEVDRRTLDRLLGMTRRPTHAELHNIVASSASTDARLDARCTTGRAICVDKSSRTVRWVVDGKVKATFEARFGGSSTPTREGGFTVLRKSRDHVSTLYHTPMPFAMFFSGGQAVHYSSDFAAVGYNGASHGCVNVRDRAGIAWLFDQAQVGDKVIVYRS